MTAGPWASIDVSALPGQVHAPSALDHTRFSGMGDEPCLRCRGTGVVRVYGTAPAYSLARNVWHEPCPCTYRPEAPHV